MSPVDSIKGPLPTLPANKKVVVKQENALANLDGKKVPAPIPQTGKKSPQKVTAPDVQKAVKQIQSYFAESQRDLHFRVDPNSGRMIITVINPETKETIRQIPPEEVMALISMMEQQGPHFIVDKA